MEICETPVRQNYVPVYRYSKYRYTSIKITGRAGRKGLDANTSAAAQAALHTLLAASDELGGLDGTPWLTALLGTGRRHDGRSAKFRQNVARFRLYRHRFLQENTRFAAVVKIYKIIKVKFLKFGKILQILQHLQNFC